MKKYVVLFMNIKTIKILRKLDIKFSKTVIINKIKKQNTFLNKNNSYFIHNNLPGI